MQLWNIIEKLEKYRKNKKESLMESIFPPLLKKINNERKYSWVLER